MAHPYLALHDPLYWTAVAVLALVIPTLLWAWRPAAPRWARPTVVVAVLMLGLPSGCYTMIGTACYGFGDCL